MTNRNKNHSRTDEAHSNKGRPARIPMSAGGKLFVPDSLKKEGYQQYWSSDRKGLVDQMLAAWWEKVEDERGEAITVPGGGGETLYLMQIKQEYYEEDIKHQQDLNISTTAKQAQKLDEDEYVPMGRKQVTEREII